MLVGCGPVGLSEEIGGKSEVRGVRCVGERVRGCVLWWWA